MVRKKTTPQKRSATVGETGKTVGGVKPRQRKRLSANAYRQSLIPDFRARAAEAFTPRRDRYFIAIPGRRTASGRDVLTRPAGVDARQAASPSRLLFDPDYDAKKRAMADRKAYLDLESHAANRRGAGRFDLNQELLEEQERVQDRKIYRSLQLPSIFERTVRPQPNPIIAPRSLEIGIAGFRMEQRRMEERAEAARLAALERRAAERIRQQRAAKDALRSAKNHYKMFEL